MHRLKSHLTDPRQTASAKVLIVDDSDVDLKILSLLLEEEGYTIISAQNGLDAINLFEKEKPDIVLMDILMPGMDGYETANHIQRLSKNKFTPILFVTALESEQVTVNCLKNGGIDSLNKPYNPTILKSKIETFASIAALYSSNIEQRKELERHNKELRTNYEVANNVFDKVMYSNVLNMPAIKYSLSPIAIFNGDILLAAYRPTGELQIMLGDFTGHGISAAIGAIPVSDIFYGMTAKGFGVSAIIEEINKKMQRILPRGLFLAAMFIEFELQSKRLSVWNAGIPNAIIYNTHEKQVTEQFASKNYPLGVNNEVSLSNTMDVYQVDSNDRLIIFTDGVIEARNKNNEMYGLDALVQDIAGESSGWILDRLKYNLSKFTHGQQQSDDTTIFEIDFNAIEKQVEAKKEIALPDPPLNSNWQLDYCFGASILKTMDPIPNLIQTIMELQKLHKHKQDVFVIIKELFVNALDHGLLGLSSEIKQNENGFSAYIKERQRRLESLDTGHISIHLNHMGSDQGGDLYVDIEDTGAGFDFEGFQDKLTTKDKHHGRGIYMVNSICEDLSYNDNGNAVHAHFAWSKNQ